MTMRYLWEIGNSGASVSHGHISSLYSVMWPKSLQTANLACKITQHAKSYQGPHRLEKDYLEKSLKIKIALKST